MLSRRVLLQLPDFSMKKFTRHLTRHFHLGPPQTHFNVFFFNFFLRNHFNVLNVDISFEIVDVLSSGVYINKCQKIYCCVENDGVFSNLLGHLFLWIIII